MRLFSYELDGSTCMWAQLEEPDIAQLLSSAGYQQIPCGPEQTPDFTKEDHVVELKCVEEDPLFPNGSLRYIENRDDFARKIQALKSGDEGSFTIRFRTGFLLKRAERLLRKAKHQLAAHRAQGRCTGVIVVNNASYSIGMARQMFGAALRRKAKESGMIDFVVSVNVFAQSATRPRIDVMVLTCSDDPRAGKLGTKVATTLKGLPRAIRQAARTMRPQPHQPPVAQITIPATG